MSKRIKVQKSINYKFEVNFWRGFHFEFSERKVAIVQVCLENEKDSKDRMTFAEYMASKRLSLTRATSVLQEVLSSLEFPHRRENLTGKRLKLLTADDLSLLKKHLEEMGDELRGMRENSVIVCGDGTSFLVADRCVGGVPSVEIPEVTYPDAIYQERDTDRVMVEAGTPVVVFGRTKEKQPYPSRFRQVKKLPPRKGFDYWFAVEYETQKCKAEPPSRPYFGIGVL